MSISGVFKSFFSKKTDVFAKYEVMRRAISGTMSKFYMVRDRQTREILGLKVLDKEKTAAIESRWRGLKKPSEGEIALQLQHERLVRTLRHGITVDDEPYILMEFLDGPGLNSAMITQSDSLKQNRLRLLRQAAEAVQAVHDAGFIHRDICPRNYVVSKDHRDLKLIDFGLTVPDEPPFRQPGNRTGTAAYMSPEVVRRRTTDRRVDIYSFGVTAYEMLTRQLPWNTSRDGQGALMHDQIEPTPLEELYPNIDPTLADAVMKCFHKDADGRFSSLNDFVAAIRPVRAESRD